MNETLVTCKVIEMYSGSCRTKCFSRIARLRAHLHSAIIDLLKFQIKILVKCFTCISEVWNCGFQGGALWFGVGAPRCCDRHDVARAELISQGGRRRWCWYRQTLDGSFSAVSTPIFVSKYSCESSRREKKLSPRSTQY